MTDLLADYETELRRLRRTPATIKDYMGLLTRMENELPCGVAVATGPELEGWIFVAGRGETTLAHYVTVVRGFGKWAVDQERLEWHGSDELPEPKADSREIRPATEDEWRRIVAEAYDPWADLYHLAGRAGLRSIEVARVRREDLTEREIRVYGKGNKWRTVPTHPKLWERFADRQADKKPLVRNPKGLPLSEAQVVQRGRYHLHRLGLDLSMHGLRKRYAMRIYEESGHDIRLVQHLLGHRYVSTTQRYLGVDGERAAEVTARID